MCCIAWCGGLTLPCVLYCRGAEGMVQQAREWESSGEYARAVECYMKITPAVTSDQNIMEKCWMKVGFLNCCGGGGGVSCVYVCVGVKMYVCEHISLSLSLSGSGCLSVWQITDYSAV